MSAADKRRRQHIRQTFKKVRLLSLATPKARRQIVAEGDRELIDSLCECCANILRGIVPLQAKDKAKLKRHKNKLRKLVKKKLSLSGKKDIIQKGGNSLLRSIVDPIVSALTSVFTGGTL